MTDEAYIKNILRTTPDLWRILQLIRRLGLPQGCLAAGSIRNSVWQALSGQPIELLNDVDVVFFDPQRPANDDLVIDEQLQQWAPQYQWQVKNEVYMAHYNFNDGPTFDSVVDAIGHFVEVPTCIGARLTSDDQLELITPHGVQDLMALKCRPIPMYQQDARHLAIYQQRMQAKQWQQRWPKLQVSDH